MNRCSRELLTSIAGVSPNARDWAAQQIAPQLTHLHLSTLGRSALDSIPRDEVVEVTSLILTAIQRLGAQSNAGLLAGAGLALISGPRSFALVRNLYKTFLEIERVGESERPVAVLARLGNQLSVPDGRVLLTFLAQLKQLDRASRQLAQEASETDAPHPKLVFRALQNDLPERISDQCSARLRHDLLVVHLMTQARPAPSLLGRLFSFFGLVSTSFNNKSTPGRAF